MSEQTQEQELVRQSMTEVTESLTGFDEIAIEQAFGAGIGDLLENKATTAARALLFVLRRRDGLKDGEARKVVMEMRLGDVQDYFDTGDEHEDEDSPVSEPGKGDGSPD